MSRLGWPLTLTLLGLLAALAIHLAGSRQPELGDRVTAGPGPAGRPLVPVRRLGSARLRHGASVRALAFSPDGTSLASGGEDLTVSLWDVATGGERWRRRLGRSICGLTFAPDGRDLVASSSDGVHEVLSATTGASRLRLLGGTGAGDGSVALPAYSPAGDRIAVVGRDGQVRVREREGGRLLEVIAGSPWPAALIAFSGPRGQAKRPDLAVPAGRGAVASPDGRLVATCSGASVELWEAATGRTSSLGASAYHVAFSADSGWLAAASYGGFRVWDVASGAVRLEVPAAHSQTTAVAVAAGGRVAASAGYGGEVRLWEVASGKERLGGEGHTSRVTALAFSPDAARLATGGDDQRVLVWDWRSGALLESRDLGGHAGAIAFLPGGGLAAIGVHRLRVWPAGGDAAPAVDVALGGWGGTFVALAPAQGYAIAAREAVERIDLGDGSRRWSLPLSPLAAAAAVVSRDGGTVAVCAGARESSVLVLIDSATGRERSRTDVGKTGCVPLAFTAQGDLLAGWPVLYRWQLRSRGPVLQHAVAVRGWTMAISSDGALAAVSGEDGAVRVLDLAPQRASASTQPRLAGTSPHRGGITALVFSPDGRTLATAGEDSTVAIWNATGAALAPPLPAPSAGETLVEAPAEDLPVVEARFEGALEGRGIVPTPGDDVAWWFVPGAVGEALELHGELTLGELAEIELPGSFTFETWIRLEPGCVDPGDYVAVIRSEILTLDLREGIPHLFLHFPGGGHTYLALTAMGRIAPGEWHHLAVVRDAATATARVYLGGELLLEKERMNERLASRIGPLTLGGEGWGARRAFAGAIDELVVYAHARDAAAVAADAERGGRGVRLGPEVER